MVASTLLVQADLSGTTYAGTFNPTDITRFVRLADGVSITNWRQDAQSEISPSTLALTLDNEALPGDATAPNAGRFTPGLSTSPWTGRLLPGVRIRVTETVGGTPFQLFDGYVTDWTTQPGQDDGTFPVTVVNCVDILGWMGTLQPLYSIAVEEMLLRAPTSLHPLYDADGSSSATDLLGGASAVPRSSKTGAGTLKFGADTTIVDQPGAVSFDSADYDSNVLAQGFFRQTVLDVPNHLPASGAFSISFWIEPTTVAPTNTVGPYLAVMQPSPESPNSNGLVSIAIKGFSTGVLQWTVVGAAGSLSTGGTGTRSVCDGRWHHVLMVFAADGKSATLYLDGTLEGAATAGADIVWQNSGVDWTLGGYVVLWTGFGGSPFRGSMALFGQYASALTAANATAINTAGVTAFAGESTSTHVVRLLAYRPNVGSVIGSGRGTVGPHKTSGLTLQRALLDTAKAEGGVLFANGAGQIVLFSRGRLYDVATSATFDAEADITASDFQVRIDTQQLINDMTVSWPSGSDQRVADATSKATYGPRQSSDTYIVNGNRDAADGAGWVVANQKNAQVRTPNITADITTMASTAQAQAVLGRSPLDRIGLSNLPPWAPPTDVIVQGRSIRITDTEFTVGFFATPLWRKTLRADAAASANTKLDAGLVIPW